MQNAPPDAAVQRFRNDLERLIPTANARLGVAVSGGPDSLALMLLCHAAYPDRTRVATVDHQLRVESRNEAEFVRTVCAALGLSHTTLVPSEPITGSLQSAARRVRYAVLEGWADQNEIDAILTAHHADDQAETLLMRLNRGAGIGGLAGVRSVNGRIVRPLLRWRRSELTDIVRHSGISPALDPSNDDEKYDRVRIRKAIASSSWLDPVAMAQSAVAQADGDAALGWMEDRLFAERVQQDGETLYLNDPQSLPIELQRRLLVRCVQTLDPDWKINGPDLQRLAETLRNLGKSSIGRLVGRATSDFWEFTPAPPRRKN
jgi:tRNA(Ile)-lysidine synthase